MKRFLLLAPLVLSLAVPSLAAPRRAPRGWNTYDGPWFSAFYPTKWKAVAGKSPALTGGGKSDAAFFSSPDGRAQFAVYSPMWNGRPTELYLDPKREKLISSLTVPKRTKDGINSLIESRWRTYKALNGSYTRSIVDVENTTLNSRLVFGFRYKDAATYKKYLPQFRRFKTSLVQYLD